MRKSLLILLCLSMSYFLMAQETIKQKEIGLVFSSLDNFGLTFKTGTEKALWRFNTLFVSGGSMANTADSMVNEQSSFGFGFKIGKEFRKDLVEKLELRFGADLSFSYAQSKSEIDDKSVNDYDRVKEQTTYRPGVNLVFGFNYELSDNFMIGAELLPSFNYNTGTSIEKIYYTNNGDEVKSDISGISFGLSNTPVLLSLSYRF